MKNKNKNQKNDDLRNRAEARVPRDDEDLNLAVDDIMKLIHELRVHQVELEMQNEEIRSAQDMLEKSRAEYVDLYDFAPVGYLTLDRRGVILKANLTSASMLEIERGALINKPFSIFVSRDSSHDFFTFIKKIFEEQLPHQCEIQIKNGKNEEIFVRIDSNCVIESDGKANQCKLAMVDITGRKLAEERMKKLLSEKDILLKEVHHRVKNNFQTILSLLSLQEENIADVAVLNEFSEIKSRMNAMSLIHERLYKSEDVSRIKMSEYFNSMAQELYHGHKKNNAAIKFEIDVPEDLTMHLDTAIPLGLVVNEILTNSLKYAFPDGTAETGIVSITAHPINDNSIVVVLRDNGIGIPDDVDITTSKTLGMKLIQLLTEKQLGGKLEIIKDKGTKFVISFKNE